jgi:DNA-binding transcriptional MerR regulator
MTKTITFTTKDICSALRIAKHQLRGWTEKLEPYSKAQTRERSARKFSLGDLHFLATIDYLESYIGVPVSRLIPISEQLNHLIKTPSGYTRSKSLLHICFVNNRCKWIEADSVCTEGLMIDINNAHKKINEFLGLPSKQVELQLGLAMVS